MSTLANVRAVRVDDEGIFARTDAEVVLDVLFDDRRIWSFWLKRDGVADDNGFQVPWPGALRRFLQGNTRLKLVEHVNQRVLFDEDVHLGEGEDRIAVVNAKGLPLGIDKSLRLAQTFDTRSPEQVKPLLDSIEEVLEALGKAGIDAFLAYGTLLGAVRGGELIGHDSDADLGYVSRHTHPVDVMRESFALQRALAEMGYPITRYSGIAFKVDVQESDGSVRGLDVFGGFLSEDGYLYLMGEIRTPFQRDWIFPLGTTTLEGREFPAPADTDRFLVATYGPSWRVPDPAYIFETPESTHRRLNGWFRGMRIRRADWDRVYSGLNLALPDLAPSPFARWVKRREHGAPERVVDIGCGRGVDALWFARHGSRVVGMDFVLRGSDAVAEVAAREGVDVEFRHVNLCETRSVLAVGTRMAHEPGRKVLIARNIAEATDAVGRHNLWRLCEMMLRGGGRLYLEFLVSRGERDPFASRNKLRTLPVELVTEELAARGGTVLSAKERRVRSPETHKGHRISRMVVEWER